MRKQLTAVAAILAVCVLAGCTGGSGTPKSSKTTGPTRTTVKATTKPSPNPVVTASGPSRFVLVVKQELPEIAKDRTDQDIQAISDTACAALAAGDSADEIVAVTRSLGTLDAEATDQATARELIKLAIDSDCLKQATRVDEF
ncbi:hypothetical protein GCM10010112_24230 [Actinoplanes lobatus]|uniref:Putative small lipoprotein YifL n=1 Tax=Actinoplanes lobatus TaxID=113568 RepID=A0A7W7HJ49_9ACTN|nr:hypothetical protein [Actinoplanes lobatus]MBB4751465.1 putative small lipoprotein YifL [Actinoplanes lobatus]GGN64241.1 hypothetical protein GCM10010112_24230 [Actinoplanes lobatus]GIE41074.1 hypothetical protein Alo02nite_39720 [Actinoplanes lobatus]